MFGVWPYPYAAVMVTKALHTGNQWTACPHTEEKPAQRQAQGVMKRSVRNQSQICLFTEAGEVVHQRIQTQRQRFATVFAERPTARILIEAST